MAWNIRQAGLEILLMEEDLQALTPVIYKKSIPAAPEKFAEIARLLGGKDENELVDILERLLETLELKTSLGDEGVKMEDVDWMTENDIQGISCKH